MSKVAHWLAIGFVLIVCLPTTVAATPGGWKQSVDPSPTQTDSPENGESELASASDPHHQLMRDRVIESTIIGCGLIALLGLLFAYLRMEHITRGFYSGRLQLVAVGLAGLIIATCYLIWRNLIG